MPDAITVSQLNRYLKAIFDEDKVLKNIYISGEISNFRAYSRSGHLYFTLKDEDAALKCVMFSSYAERLKFMPEDGMHIICLGHVSVYEKTGEYQLYAYDMQPLGTGSYIIAFNQLKERLDKEGLFSQSSKKDLPAFPMKIGVATSTVGDAVEDIKNISARRFPLAEIVIAPTLVQGNKAPEDIVSSIKALESYGVDVIIVGRGGGSIEDLWAFNSESVARAIYECQVPVVSAVGHETDYTICDFVSDMRAPTPSAAAELVCPDINILFNDVKSMKNKLNNIMTRKLETLQQHVSYLSNSHVLTDYEAVIDINLNKVHKLDYDISKQYSNTIDLADLHFRAIVVRLDALSPLSVLKRGYSITKKNNVIVKTVKDLHQNDNLSICMSDGIVNCVVREVENDGQQ